VFYVPFFVVFRFKVDLDRFVHSGGVEAGDVFPVDVFLWIFVPDCFLQFADSFLLHHLVFDAVEGQVDFVFGVGVGGVAGLAEHLPIVILPSRLAGFGDNWFIFPKGVCVSFVFTVEFVGAKSGFCDHGFGECLEFRDEFLFLIDSMDDLPIIIFFILIISVLFSKIGRLFILIGFFVVGSRLLCCCVFEGFRLFVIFIGGAGEIGVHGAPEEVVALLVFPGLVVEYGGLHGRAEEVVRFAGVFLFVD
jgi:hypothetical protein